MSVFNPELADVRFGYGLSPNIKPPENTADLLAGLQAADDMAVRFPIETFDTFRERMVALQLQFKIEAQNRGTEKAEAAREGTLIAIAIEQYRRRHGNWPIQLEDLVPDHLTRLPVDRINGEPLQYRMTDEGPRIYSVGGDRDDDGGNIARGRPNQPIERGIAAFWFASYQDNPYFDGDWLLYPSPTRLPEAFLKQTSAELDQDPKQIRLH